MESEKMVEFSYRCKCGAIVYYWATKQLTDVEIASLKERDCDSCPEKDLETIDDEICT